jgi:protein Mpv17
MWIRGLASPVGKAAAAPAAAAGAAAVTTMAASPLSSAAEKQAAARVVSAAAANGGASSRGRQSLAPARRAFATATAAAAAPSGFFASNPATLLRPPVPGRVAFSSKAGEEASKVAAAAAAAPAAAAPAATPAAAAAAASSPSLLQWYEGHLRARPVPTKMATGCLLWGVGDAVAQLVPRAVAEPGTRPPHRDDYDWARTGRACLFGFALHAPTSHVHFNFLEWMTNRAGLRGLSVPIFKAFMEQFVYWSWISNSMYHGAMGAMQGMSVRQCCDRIADVLWETQKAQWAFWIPVQLLNFRFVPVRHQLNVVLLTSIVWTALLSAWYPPSQEDDDDDDDGEPQETKGHVDEAAPSKLNRKLSFTGEPRV